MTDIFDSKPMDTAQLVEVNQIKDKAKQLYALIDAIPPEDQPRGQCARNANIAKTLLEDCVMRAVKAVSRQGE